jgi:hypothetical protein
MFIKNISKMLVCFHQVFDILNYSYLNILRIFTFNFMMKLLSIHLNFNYILIIYISQRYLSQHLM